MSKRNIFDDHGQHFSYEYITNREEAEAAWRTLDPEKIYGLDFETTALTPQEGKVRLSSITGHNKHYLFDHFSCGDFEEVWAERFSSRTWAVFNACFEGKWIDYCADNQDVDLLDVQYMRAAKMGGSPMMRLTYIVKQELKIDISKEEQNSSWAAPTLTRSQIDYAMSDSHWNYLLYKKFKAELSARQWNGFRIINDAWRATVEMEQNTPHLDVAYHTKLLKWWTLKRDTAYRYMRKLTPPEVIANLNSDVQVGKFLERELDPSIIAVWPRTGKTKRLAVDKATLKQAAYRLSYPASRWLAAMIVYNKYEKLTSTYGQKLIDCQINRGLVTARFNMARAVTGRYSSSAFNLQNVPRNPVVRRSFVASAAEAARYTADPENYLPETVFVMADYSSIEVRVLAEIAHDAKLLEDATYGDVHARSASQIFGHDFDYFTAVLKSEDPEHPDYNRYGNIRPLFKDQRSRAKAFTFQLLYGAGAGALAIVLRCTDEEAYSAIEAWGTVYTKAFNYRQYMYEVMNVDGFLPVIDGRTMFVFRDDRTMPVAANWPIQGAAASVMYCALTRNQRALYERPRIPARMAATIHDEILVRSKASHAKECSEILIDSMVKGWLDVFPNTNTDNLIGKGNKAKIAFHWGAK